MQNKVFWFPWGQEAFQLAKREQKPVLLQIGFPSCYWCHRMEDESLLDGEVTALLAEHYICVAVDREQRPDIDAIYMIACQAMTGQAGWPLTVFMNHLQEPFYACGYLSKEELIPLLKETIAQWNARRDRVNAQSAQLTRVIRDQYHYTTVPAMPDQRLMQNTVHAYKATYDFEWGGTGIAPKFPMPHTIQFLLRYAYLHNDAEALHMAETTLQRMSEGSIFDHVGGGFMRYATDRQWLHPHYEKLLCDNALLADVMLEAWQITQRPLYRSVAERTLAFILREMTHENQYFFSSQNADAGGLDGAYYKLTRKEMLSLLGQLDGEAYCKYYALTESAVPHRIGHHGGIETARMTALNERVRAYRLERTPLRTNETVITRWNAQMIATFARAYQALGNELYLDIARKAATWARENLQNEDETVFTCWHQGNAWGDGTLDDYANLAEAALALYRVTLDAAWLSWAVSLSRVLLESFEDRAGGGFYLTPRLGERLIARPKETFDGAYPSGNTVTLSVLVTLSLLDVGVGWAEAAKRQAEFLIGVASDAPVQHMGALSAAMPLVYPVTRLEAKANRDENQRLLQTLNNRYLPYLYLKALQPGISGNRWQLCKGTSCLSPFHEIEQVLAAL